MTVEGVRCFLLVTHASRTEADFSFHCLLNGPDADLLLHYSTAFLDAVAWFVTATEHRQESCIQFHSHTDVR